MTLLFDSINQRNVKDVTDVVDTWDHRKTNKRVFTYSDAMDFCATQNYLCKKLVSLTGYRDPQVWQDAANQAQSVVTFLDEPGKVDSEVEREASRMLVTLFEREHVNFWVSFMELCINASTVTDRKARLRLDGRDVTDL